MNPMRFSEKPKDHQLAKLIDQSSTYHRWLVGFGWAFSAALTFAFCFTWLSPLFSPLFIPLFPNAGQYIGGLMAGLWGLYIYDFGALVWLFKYVQSCETHQQMDIAKQVLWVDFIGSVVASVAQIFFALSGVIINLDPSFYALLSWGIIIVSVGVFSFNVFQSIRFYLASPAVIRAKHEATQRASRTEQQFTIDTERSNLELLAELQEVQKDLAVMKAGHEAYMAERDLMHSALADKAKRQKVNNFLNVNNLETEVVAENTPTPSPTIKATDEDTNFHHPQP